LLPLFLALAWLLRRVARPVGQWLAAQLLLFSIVFPCLAGLDSDRSTLYLDLCGLALLGFIAWLLVKRLEQSERQPAPAVAASPVHG
jgi:flagellar biogenesis protein FliO